MITVRIDENTLLDMLMCRVEYWTSDSCTQDLFRDYYESLIDSGCFEGYELDIMDIADNDYVNNLTTISKEDFKQYNIEDELDDKVVAFRQDEDLYLIRTY